jgi:hypothetical protein
MDAVHNSQRLHVEMVGDLSPEQQSLYLTRHLPKRLAAGNVIIVNNRPGILLAVIRKRWATIIKEIERERASTLDRTKRQQLERELAHMRGWRFGIEPSTLDRIEALILTPEEVIGSGLQCFTLYVIMPLESEQCLQLRDNIRQNGLLVIFS